METENRRITKSVLISKIKDLVDLPYGKLWSKNMIELTKLYKVLLHRKAKGELECKD